MTAIALVPARPELVLAGTTTGAVYRSSDGGKSWQRSATSPERAAGDAPAPGVSSIAVDPTDPRMLYASMYWGAVFRSTDGGNHWQEAPLGLSGHADARQIVVDPFDRRTVWLGLWGESGVFVSKDSGRTWKHAWGKDCTSANARRSHRAPRMDLRRSLRAWVVPDQERRCVLASAAGAAANREVETLMVAGTSEVLSTLGPPRGRTSFIFASRSREPCLASAKRVAETHL